MAKVEKLADLIAKAREALSEDQLAEAIASGQFEEIFALPQKSFEILRDTSDPGLVLRWAQFADVRIDSVVKMELHKYASPKTVGDRETLEKILALEDSLTIQALMQKGVDEREVLLGLPTSQTKWILTELSSTEIVWVLSYLLELPSSSQGRLIDFVFRDRGLISLLQETEGLQSQFVAVLNLAGEFDEINSILVELRRRRQNAEKYQKEHAEIDLILAEMATAEVKKLSLLVYVASEVLDAEQLADMVESGQLKEILALSQNTYEILRETGSPAVVLAWVELAGEAIDLVVETKLYKHAAPSDFDSTGTLARILALGNPVAVERLMNLDAVAREALLQLPTPKAVWTLTELRMKDLVWVASYLSEFPVHTVGLLADTVMRDDVFISTLQDSESLQEQFPTVLALAAASEAFSRVLERTAVREVAKLTALVVAAQESMTPEQMIAAIETGQFERILALPERAFEILRDNGEPAVILAWNDLAGDAIDKVVATELYNRSAPSDFDSTETLLKVLAIGDGQAIGKIMDLTMDERAEILNLPKDLTKAVLETLSGHELSSLASRLMPLGLEDKAKEADRTVMDQAQPTVTPAPPVAEPGLEPEQAPDFPILYLFLAVVSLTALYFFWKYYRRRR
ncbi:MAG: hypothetical protein F4Y42_03805 [Caldilineaceae bacterium SB0664_bin_27]|uniref:Uncharacterized protein n=1 Tax=Caldilineaceae bacterium SB0664_bin_27 TaxID=2605260 RepID=A0A6B0YNA6_9CHLR|nr:hypothetical protein [Caldilineaceae bacterium SB0664_bin_27]